MPELPEVETVRSGLERLVLGRRVQAVEVLRASAVRRQAAGSAEFIDLLLGAEIQEVARRGKFGWFVLDRSDLAWVWHLGMSGQLLVDEEPVVRRHSRLRVDLGGLWLDFVDQRTFGHMTVSPLVPTADGAPGGQGTASSRLPALSQHIARDVLDPWLNRLAVVERVRRSSRQIKAVLLDQNVLSGIGNIYADEALWAAGVHPHRAADSLSDRQVLALLTSAKQVMEQALAVGGTSFEDRKSVV